MQLLLSGIIAAIISLGAVFVPHPEQPLSPQMQAAMQAYVVDAMKQPIFGTTQPIGGQTYLLAGSGVSQTGTSITLSSFTITQNGYKIPDSALSDTFYITLEPGNPSKQEIVSCTIDTQNANGTATFSGCTRGLSPIPDYTASSSLRFAHGGGTSIIFSNPPQFYADFAQLQNANTFSGAVTFTNSPTLTNACTVGSANSALCDKHYIDTQVSAGAANANETTAGLVELATGREVASSTSIGSTAARLALPASLASSSPSSSATTTIVATQLDGKINPLFIATSSNYTYNWGALMNFTGAVTINSNSTSSISKGIYSSQIFAPYFGATSTTATSSFLGGVSMGNATTTNLEIGGVCTNCISGYEVVSSSGAGPTVAGNGVSQNTTCSAGKRIIGGGTSDNDGSGKVLLRDSYPSAPNQYNATFMCFSGSGGCSANTITTYAICAYP